MVYNQILINQHNLMEKRVKKTTTRFSFLWNMVAHFYSGSWVTVLPSGWIILCKIFKMSAFLPKAKKNLTSTCYHNLEKSLYGVRPLCERDRKNENGESNLWYRVVWLKSDNTKQYTIMVLVLVILLERFQLRASGISIVRLDADVLFSFGWCEVKRLTTWFKSNFFGN